MRKLRLSQLRSQDQDLARPGLGFDRPVVTTACCDMRQLPLSQHTAAMLAEGGWRLRGVKFGNYFRKLNNVAKLKIRKSISERVNLADKPEEILSTMPPLKKKTPPSVFIFSS